MKAVEIKPGIFWVGGIDWNLRNFHGYRTQRGTTYNAYLILDERVTLIDTVKHYLVDEMLERIRDVIDPEKIDLIVSNHVEMDHSGGLPHVAAMLPGRGDHHQHPRQDRPGGALRHRPEPARGQERRRGQHRQAHAPVPARADGPLAGLDGDLHPRGEAAAEQRRLRPAHRQRGALRRRGGPGHRHGGGGQVLRQHRDALRPAGAEAAGRRVRAGDRDGRHRPRPDVAQGPGRDRLRLQALVGQRDRAEGRHRLRHDVGLDAGAGHGAAGRPGGGGRADEAGLAGDQPHQRPDDVDAGGARHPVRLADAELAHAADHRGRR